MSTTTHNNQPALCISCLATVLGKAEAAPRGHRVIQLCDHAGPEGVILAVGSTHNHSLVHWHIEGPMTYEQANATATAVLEQFRKSGMTLHKIQTQ